MSSVHYCDLVLVLVNLSEARGVAPRDQIGKEGVIVSSPASPADAVQSIAKLFEGRSRAEQMALLAALERAGAAVYRALAANEAEEAVAKELLAAAAREEQNAELLEHSSS